ncbi:hypothetical protein E2C01_065054 [Portunus trituberculatus]|uniref:Uncharacterized protein n=1 Tax=Portunus trituberculatus TaxID=210409 RepID=A0A5B7HMG3_PORTR|nr:hypothetical protein [Portunus trituberculatus]
MSEGSSAGTRVLMASVCTRLLAAGVSGKLVGNCDYQTLRAVIYTFHRASSTSTSLSLGIFC